MTFVIEKELKVHIEYDDLRADFSGNFNEVWRLLNSFLNKVSEVIAKAGLIKVEKMSIPEVILSLRNANWFDTPRDWMTTYQELKKKAFPGVKPEATMMALAFLVRKGKMKRYKKERKYFYFAPWVEVSESH